MTITGMRIIRDVLSALLMIAKDKKIANIRFRIKGDEYKNVIIEIIIPSQ